jgi:hypothetical protein
MQGAGILKNFLATRKNQSLGLSTQISTFPSMALNPSGQIIVLALQLDIWSLVFPKVRSVAMAECKGAIPVIFASSDLLCE